MKPLYHFIFFLLAGALLQGCSVTNLFTEPGGKPDTSVSALDNIFLNNPDYQYHIQVDDKVSISVWQQDELSVGSVYGIYNSNEVYGKWLLVDAGGNIEIPRLGTVNVEHMTVISLKDSLSARFGEYLVNPIVDVKIMNKEISILGEVRNPQVVTLDTEQSRLLDVIARANGFEFYADTKRIRVLRQIGPDVHMATIDLTQSDSILKRNIALYPGDVVIVPAKNSKRIDRQLSNIIPFTSVATAVAILFNAL
ncbi:MAG: polysaccharide export protein [Balneolaceae bacterium]|nr:MAG: polysaccharide export protein [Balneolaceae bacterium]